MGVGRTVPVADASLVALCTHRCCAQTRGANGTDLHATHCPVPDAWAETILLDQRDQTASMDQRLRLQNAGTAELEQHFMTHHDPRNRSAIVPITPKIALYHYRVPGWTCQSAQTAVP